MVSCSTNDRTFYSYEPSNNEVIGTYETPTSWHNYTLILQDSSEYITIDQSDIFSERTIGIWTLQGQTVRLNPKKKTYTRITDRAVQEETITESKEEVVIVVTKDRLMIPNGDTEINLERTK